jgi:hypothetical protein
MEEVKGKIAVRAKDAKELQVVQIKEVDNSPAVMLQMAMDKGIDLEKLEKIIELQERYEANQAKKAYAQDFASAQAEIQPVAKKSLNPQTHSKYADLSGVIEVSQPIYTKYGFSVIFYEGETTKTDHMRLYADVFHRLGHKETYYYDAPLETTGIKGNAMMTRQHGKASSVSYSRRYLMCMIWNISTKDNDGNAPAEEVKIDENKVAIINGLITELAVDMPKFLEFMSVEKVEDINAKDFAKAKLMLEAKRKAKK